MKSGRWPGDEATILLCDTTVFALIKCKKLGFFYNLHTLYHIIVLAVLCMCTRTHISTTINHGSLAVKTCDMCVRLVPQVALPPSPHHLPWQCWSGGGLCVTLGPCGEPSQQLNALLQLQVSSKKRPCKM